MRINNRASMQLSINAIVILVMAMAVLGIGLGLIRGVLAPAQTNLEEALGKVDLSETATSTKTIANIGKSMKLKPASSNEIVVSFYNKDDASCASSATVRVNCESDAAIKTVYDGVLALPAPVGQATTLLAIVTPTGGSGSVPCKVEIVCSTGTIAETTLVQTDGTFIPIVSTTTVNPHVAEDSAVFVDFLS